MFSVNYFCRLRQLFLPVHPLFPTPLLGHSGAVAWDVEFQDDRVVDHPVDGRRRSHWVGKDVLPLGEDQVGRDAQGPAFVAFGSAQSEPNWRAANPTYRRTSGPSSPTASSTPSWGRYPMGGG